MPRSSKRPAASVEGSESSRRIKFSRGSTAQRSQTTNNETIQEEPEDDQPSESGAGETVKEEAETAVKVSARIHESSFISDESHLERFYPFTAINNK